MIEAGGGERVKPSGVGVEGVAVKMVQNSLDELKEPDKNNAKPAMQILTALVCSSGAPSASSRRVSACLRHNEGKLTGFLVPLGSGAQIGSLAMSSSRVYRPCLTCTRAKTTSPCDLPSFPTLRLSLPPCQILPPLTPTPTAPRRTNSLRPGSFARPLPFLTPTALPPSNPSGTTSSQS